MKEAKRITLPPIKNNRATVLRGMRDYTIRRENKTMFIEILIGDQSVIIEVPYKPP